MSFTMLQYQGKQYGALPCTLHLSPRSQTAHWQDLSEYVALVKPRGQEGEGHPLWVRVEGELVRC